MSQIEAIAAYRDEIEYIFSQAEQEIGSFPAGLSGLGHALLKRSNPLQNGGGANVISYLLPYWFREQTGSPLELCRDLAIGNIYAMLHFFLLDDVMDGGTGRLDSGVRGSLALGQLLQGQFQQRYQRHFAADSPLWDYYRKYLGEWAAAVFSEGAQPIDPYDPGQLARKAAPVKLCAAGLLMHATRQEKIAAAEEAVDLALAVLQLSDDWADWRDDLPEPGCNGFLSLVREKLGLSADCVLDEKRVKRAIYHRQCLEQLADVVEKYGERLRQLSVAPQSLIAFQQEIARGIRNNAQGVNASVESLAAEGGISYFLTKFHK
ncbi:hypothetical protein [Paenibacillus sp. GCM10027626]|uniref:hypothetical protein n=1 Tax=Paenibacillus sp. GCM10027626 TaxID=3273411 RepID=UPI0036260FCA